MKVLWTAALLVIVCASADALTNQNATKSVATSAKMAAASIDITKIIKGQLAPATLTKVVKPYRDGRHDVYVVQKQVIRVRRDTGLVADIMPLEKR